MKARRCRSARQPPAPRPPAGFARTRRKKSGQPQLAANGTAAGLSASPRPERGRRARREEGRAPAAARHGERRCPPPRFSRRPPHSSPPRRSPAMPTAPAAARALPPRTASGPAPHTNGRGPASPPARRSTRGEFPDLARPAPRPPPQRLGLRGTAARPGRGGGALRSEGWGGGSARPRFPFLSFFPSGLVRSISDCKLWLSGRPNLVTSPSAADSCAAALLDRARQRHLGSSVPRSGSPLHKENVVRCAAYAGAEGNIPSIQPPTV